MQEHGAAQAPPLAVLGGRAEVGAPGQRNGGGGVPQAGAVDQHGHEDQDVAGQQHQRHRHPSRVRSAAGPVSAGAVSPCTGAGRMVRGVAWSHD